MKRNSSASVEILLQQDYKKLKEYEALGSQLECQVCLEIPLDDKGIESCPNGHIVCECCRDQIKITNERTPIKMV